MLCFSHNHFFALDFIWYKKKCKKRIGLREDLIRLKLNQKKWLQEDPYTKTVYSAISSNSHSHIRRGFQWYFTAHWSAYFHSQEQMSVVNLSGIRLLRQLCGEAPTWGRNPWAHHWAAALEGAATAPWSTGWCGRWLLCFWEERWVVLPAASTYKGRKGKKQKDKL